MAVNHDVVSAGLIDDATMTRKCSFLLHILNAANLQATVAVATIFVAVLDKAHDDMILLKYLAALNPWSFSIVLPLLLSGVLKEDGAAFYQSISVAGREIYLGLSVSDF